MSKELTKKQLRNIAESIPFDINNPLHLWRLFVDLRGYIDVCKNHGGDFNGRKNALEALRQLSDKDTFLAWNTRTPLESSGDKK